MRRLLLAFGICAMLGFAALGDAGAPAKPVPAEEYRTGWRIAASPTRGADGRTTLQARQEALLSALPHLQAAVEGNPQNSSYQADYAYVLLSAGRYQQAKEALAAAILRDNNNPRLYLLRAQAEAALAYMEPATRAENIGPALRSFADAAHNDPQNSLPLIQAASVAFEVGRTGEAIAQVKAALTRPGLQLYQLGLPEDLGATPAESVQLWHHAQVWPWMEYLARGHNAVRSLLKEGKAREEAGDLEAAAANYHLVRDLGIQVGNAKPNGFLGVNIGLNMMEDAYLSLARIADVKGTKEAERWRGEAGIVGIGRQELLLALQRYTKHFEETPATTVTGLMEYEARSVARVMLGTGLAPTHEQLPLVEPKPAKPAAPLGPGTDPTKGQQSPP